MKCFSKEVLHIIKNIADAKQIIVYGAKQRAAEIIPVCEALADNDKIRIAVTSRGGVKNECMDQYKVYEIDELSLDENTLILVAMGEHYFDEIRQMPQIKQAGCILYLSEYLIMEAKRYAACYSLKKIGIDVRLFDKLFSDDFLYTGDKRTPSVTAKAQEIAFEESARYVAEKMRTAFVLDNRYEYHIWLKKLIRDSQTFGGLNMEFGVADGDSICNFAQGIQNKFYGFDSFEGLPEDWKQGYGRGKFQRDGMPQVPKNVELIQGWYEDTLPLFAAREDMQGKTADFIHIDCDLYTSTKTVFNNIGRFIRSGTVIAFDEYFNYSGWQFDEYKAFQEFVQENGIQYKYLAYVDRNSQVCIKIL